MNLNPQPSWFKSFRPFQLEAIERIVDEFEAGRRLVVLDAPVGSGKTLIAEAVRQALTARSVYVATTKSLQQQVLRDFTHARLLMGRDNYATQLYPERLNGFDRLSCGDCEWTKADPDCSWCDDKQSCPYEIAKGRALSAELAVVNTAYYLTEVNGPGRLKDSEFVVMDEADGLESQLAGHIEIRISERRRKMLDLDPPARKTVEETWLPWVKDEALPKVQAAVSASQDDESIKGRREHSRLVQLRGKLMRLEKELPDGGWIYDYSRDEIAFKPVRVDRLAHEMLWQHGQRHLLMSGTIISAEEVTDSLGWSDPYGEIAVPMQFPVENRRVFVVPEANMTWKTKTDEWPKLARAVVKVLDAHHDERVLVHTVSYELSRYLVRFMAITPHMSRVVTYGSASEREQKLEEFKNKPGGVIIASSLERGIDLSGDLARVVIVCKAPWPNLGDKQVAARSKGGRNLWYRVQAIRSLVQMTGRAVRHENDWATAYILDSQTKKLLGQLAPQYFRDALVSVTNIDAALQIVKNERERKEAEIA